MVEKFMFLKNFKRYQKLIMISMWQFKQEID